MLDPCVELLIALLRVLEDALRALFSGGDSLLLQDYLRGEVFEELIKLDERLGDLLYVVVAGADGGEGGAGGAGTVGFELGSRG